MNQLYQTAKRMVELRQAESAFPITDYLWQHLQESGPPNDNDAAGVELELCAELHIQVLLDLRQFDAAMHVILHSASSPKVFSALSTVVASHSPHADHQGLLNALSPFKINCAMRCRYEQGEYKECVKYAEHVLACADREVCRQEPGSAHRWGQERVQALLYIAKCSECCGDVATAAEKYKQVLELDPFCTPALTAIIEHRLLLPQEQRELIEGLRLPRSAEMLRDVFLSKLTIEAAHPQSRSLLAAAATEHEKNNLREALRLTSRVLSISPFNRDALCRHLSILVDLRDTAKLFDMAHTLSQNKARGAIAVYAIGCYYYALANYERAGRYFSKGTELDSNFAEAWIAYGHCYAKLEEGEQALAVYRRALNQFPGLGCCATFVGMQYSRIHSWRLAMCFLEDARRRTPNDPLMLNEIAVLFVRNSNLPKALTLLQHAVQCINPSNPSEYRDVVLFNTATVYRKLQQYDAAIEYYTLYVKSRSQASHGHCALGFTCHLVGNLHAAIQHYHTALGLKPDAFCRDMLDRALAQQFSRGVGASGWSDPMRGLSGTPSATTDVTFPTVSRVGRSESSAPTAASERRMSSPHISVGRTLNF